MSLGFHEAVQFYTFPQCIFELPQNLIVSFYLLYLDLFLLVSAAAVARELGGCWWVGSVAARTCRLLTSATT